MAGFVPININSPDICGSAWEVVLLDDDPLVRMMWKMAAQEQGKRFIAFEKPEALYAEILNLGPKTRVYIDSDLGAAQKGQDIALDLYKRGFTELYLATGYDANALEPMPWLKGIIGKEPPNSFG
jgi:hypothetical protein